MEDIQSLSLNKKLSGKEKRQYWEAIIKDYSESGLTQRVFCQQRALKFHNFSYHLTEYRRRQSKPNEVSFVPVKLSPEDNTQSTINVSFPNGYSLNFPQSLPARHLGELLAELRKAGC